MCRLVTVGDITSEATANEVIRNFDGGKADIVVSDGAPDGTYSLIGGTQNM